VDAKTTSEIDIPAFLSFGSGTKSGVGIHLVEYTNQKDDALQVILCRYGFPIVDQVESLRRYGSA
jgi:hypothetical protein